jgi:hypothetical protein
MILASQASHTGSNPVTRIRTFFIVANGNTAWSEATALDPQMKNRNKKKKGDYSNILTGALVPGTLVGIAGTTSPRTVVSARNTSKAWLH